MCFAATDRTSENESNASLKCPGIKERVISRSSNIAGHRKIWRHAQNLGGLIVLGEWFRCVTLFHLLLLRFCSYPERRVVYENRWEFRVRSTQEKKKLN